MDEILHLEFSMSSTSYTHHLHSSLSYSPSTAMATRTIRILCLGDSLTSGYTSPLGPNHRPYAIKLKEVLERGLQGVTVVATVDGEPGALVQGQGFLQRMMAQYMNLGGESLKELVLMGLTPGRWADL